MIFEVTQDYQIMLPVMVANIVSYTVAGLLQKEALFDVLARQDGIHLPRKEDRKLRTLSNLDAARQPALVLDAAESVSSALARLSGQTSEAFVVMNNGNLAGVVTRVAMRQAVADGKSETSVGGLAVLREQYLAYPDESLARSLEKLRQGAVLLPVVSRLSPTQLLGIVEASDVLKAYRIAVEPQQQKPVEPEAREASLE